MTTPTPLHQRSLRFSIEADAALATLECALATVRRLGIELSSLRTSAGSGGMDVQMRLSAADDDALTLCRMRLHNLVGILTIREMPALAYSAGTRARERTSAPAGRLSLSDRCT